MTLFKQASASKWREIFGQNVRRLRVEQGLSQKELGQKANEVFSGNGKGLTQGNISALERGAIDPPMMTVVALSKALGVTPEQLYPSGDEELDEEVVAERLMRPRV